MSREDLSHVASGRTPWRTWIQLRRRLVAAAPTRRARPDLVTAASRAESPTLPDAWMEQEAKRQLLILCQWLQDRLANPVRVHRLPDGSRRIEVFGSVTYLVHPSHRKVATGTMIDHRFESFSCAFEIGRPLASPRWLKFVLDHLGLGVSAQCDLFFGDFAMEVAQWVEETTYRLLCRDPAFQKLRQITLPKAFRIPADIYGIALSCRGRPVGPLLDSETLNMVWRNDKAFRRVARENPHLLPLLLAFAEYPVRGRVAPVKDPVQAIKMAFRDAGLADASWRYVARHGARLFRVPWAISGDQRKLQVAMRYLEVLQSAGLPPPPPPSVAKALLHSYNMHLGDAVRVGARFEEEIDQNALRAGLIEADRRRQNGSVDGFREEFLGVCWWSEKLPELLDDNQLRAGWPSLVRQWRQSEAELALQQGADQVRWRIPVGEFEIGQLTVVPLRSLGDLIREALAMRNCLQGYAETCASGEIEIYSVRDAATGKRKGCIGLGIDDGVPTIIDIKGFANTPPVGEVRQAAQELFRRRQELP